MENLQPGIDDDAVNDEPLLIDDLDKVVVMSHPTRKVVMKLSTTEAIRVLKRQFTNVDNAYTYISLVARKRNLTQEADIAEAACLKYLEELSDEMQEDEERIAKLIRDNALDASVETGYSNPASIGVEITTPLTSQYLNFITRLNALIINIDILWFAGLMDTPSKIVMARRYENAVNKAGNKTRDAANGMKKMIRSVELSWREKAEKTALDTVEFETVATDVVPPAAQKKTVKTAKLEDEVMKVAATA